MLIGLGFTAGIAAALVCWPLGASLAPYAAPAGLAVLAVNSGALRQILLTNAALQQRNAMYAFMRWELLFGWVFAQQLSWNAADFESACCQI
jgi:hypothetical protein